MDPILSTDTTVTYAGDGVARNFTFDFPYIYPQHIKVFVDNVLVASTVPVQNVVRITAGPPTAGQIVSIERQTPTAPIITFAGDGAVVHSDDLDIAEAQARYIAEEARDIAKRGLRYDDGLGAYNAQGKRITNVDDPVRPTDALNKRSLDAKIASLIGTDPIAAILDDIEDKSDVITTLAAAIASAKTAADANYALAAALAASVASGPDGATIAARITAYLGDDGWKLGGSGGGGSAASSQTFNSNGTWTKPGTGKYALVQVWGAGGGNIGGGGAYTEKLYDLTDLPTTVSVTVGAGGTSGGGNGGTTSFGSLLSAPGGNGSSGQGGQIVTEFTGPKTGVSIGGVFNGGAGCGTASQYGGSSVFGGGGGAATAAYHGKSTNGGNGGSPSNPVQAPGGGGGPSEAGASGRVTVKVW